MLWHWIATGMYGIAKGGVHIPGISSFSKTIVAAYAVGSSSQAISEKRYTDAVKVLKPIENYEIDETSVGSAQYNLAYLYFYGHGVEKDESRARKLLIKAAEKGSDEAVQFLKGGANNDPL